MAESAIHEGFAPIIERFTESARDDFAARLIAWSSKLGPHEIELIAQAGNEALRQNARLKLNRVLLIELHAARIGEQLGDGDESERFAQFIAIACKPAFRKHLAQRYPALAPRLERTLQQQRQAMEYLVDRFITDREALTFLLGRPGGSLLGIELGQGDLHLGGQSVAKLTLEGGIVMYKPRSLRVDRCLETFLAVVFGQNDGRIRVPQAIDRGVYGWAAFARHDYCRDDSELHAFYRGLGHWLAVLRLLGGTDIHQENLIACGRVPVVIDVESLFATLPRGRPSHYGHAYDVAQTLIRHSVLRTGIVPFRAPALGLNGVDLSAAGGLPGEQPILQAPVIVNDGTTQARLQLVDASMPPAQNHPDPNPDVSQYWDDLSEGFLQATHRLRQLDAEDRLRPLLDSFEGCQVRDILRPTQVYVELGRMLWHPASLHDEEKAMQRVHGLLSSNARVVPIAPSSGWAIRGEIDDLRYGDIPVFSAPLTSTRIAETYADWRAMRVDLEELTIRSALVTTSLNRRTEWAKELREYGARQLHSDHLEARRRRLASDAVERLLRLAVRGDDGSVTWITPETSHAGWMVQPLQGDVYFGLGGVVVALAGYRREVDDGRANPVAGLGDALEGALQMLRALDTDKPRTIGGFTGYGAQIWTWLTLHDLLPRTAWVEHAVRSAQALEREGFDGDRLFDILDGSSGVIVPLLQLARVTGNDHWLALAARAANHLESRARIDERGACWPSEMFAEPIGGFAHGATGIGWALMRVALSHAGSTADRSRWQQLAHAAFAFQDSLYDDIAGNWLDVRQRDISESFHTWCNGSVGIGLAACDLYARTQDTRYLHTLRRAVAASQDTWGANHTLCHGDFSLWELFTRASQLDPEGSPSDRDMAMAHVVTAIEDHGVIGGMTRGAFTPGLMTGLAGAVHSLSRMHPDCRLASPLLQEEALRKGSRAG
ncbi:type 2 lanthipeptide synthetase LanM family protein [Dyella sp.]|uniref:type 2 lanthipeptide synthetase LanM family protein n=1 Tax=Dyella sp. TaxID=1869338 RepID=UPI002ED211EC